MTAWSEQWTQAIGQQIRLLRGERSAQWVADETASLGHPVSRTAISEYESGKRKSMPVADLAVIASALDTPPVTLLYPGLPHGEVERLPGRPTTAIGALMWFSGDLEETAGINLTRPYFRDDRPGWNAVRASRHLVALTEMTSSKVLGAFIEMLRGSESHDEEQGRWLLERLRTLRARCREWGLVINDE